MTSNVIVLKSNTKHWRLSAPVIRMVEEAFARVGAKAEQIEQIDSAAFDDLIDLFACDVCDLLRDKGYDMRWSSKPQSRGVGVVAEHVLDDAAALAFAEALESAQLHHLQYFIERAEYEIKWLQSPEMDPTKDAQISAAIASIRNACDTLVRLLVS